MKKRKTHKSKFLAGADGRTTASRRIKDIYLDLEELVSVEGQALNIIQESLARQLSCLLVAQEQEVAKLAAATEFDRGQFLRAANVCVRLFRALGVLPDDEDDDDPTETLERYVANKGKAKGNGSTRTGPKRDRRRARLVK